MEIYLLSEQGLCWEFIERPSPDSKRCTLGGNQSSCTVQFRHRSFPLGCLAQGLCQRPGWAQLAGWGLRNLGMSDYLSSEIAGRLRRILG